MKHPLFPSCLLGLTVLLFSQTACIQHRQLVNFDSGPSFDSLQAPVQAPVLRIQHDDLLAISLLSQTADPKVTAPFQAATTAGGVGPAEP